MAIVDFSATLCVSTRRHEIEEVVRLVGEPASRVSAAASTARNDRRVFWDFDTKRRSLDEAWPALVEWASQRADVLAPIEDAAIALWCTMHADSEFAGLALQAAHMQMLGSRRIDLVLSAYANSDDST